MARTAPVAPAAALPQGDISIGVEFEAMMRAMSVYLGDKRDVDLRGVVAEPSDKPTKTIAIDKGD